jgi:hypothetical protein
MQAVAVHHGHGAQLHIRRQRGRAAQVDPIKSTFKAPGLTTKRLKLEYDDPLSKLAFKFNLRRYNVSPAAAASAISIGRAVQADAIKIRVESAFGFIA